MDVGEALKEIFREYGRGVFEDAKILKGLLADYGAARGALTRVCVVLAEGRVLRFADFGDELAWRRLVEEIAADTDYSAEKTEEAAAWVLRAMGAEISFAPKPKPPVEWIFYIDKNDGYCLCKELADGAGRTKLADGKIFIFTKDEDWLYYSDMDTGIYRVDHDGGCKSKISGDRTWGMVAGGGWLYYSNLEDAHSLYKILPDGTGKTRLNKDETYDMVIEGAFIFYTNGSDGDRRYKIKTDGTGRVGL